MEADALYVAPRPLFWGAYHMSTLRGSPLVSCSLHVPPAGGAWAELVVSSGGAPVLGAATLRIGDLALVGAVTRSYEEDADKPVCIFETGAGWHKLLALGGAYSAPGGVRLSTVLRDLAGRAGELYDAPAEVLLPPVYEWPASTPRAPLRIEAVLADLVSRGAIPTWRVTPAGRTRFDAWPSLGAADRSARVLSRDLRRGIRHLGLDGGVAAVLPGATIEGITIARLWIHETTSALTAEAWSA